MNLPAMKSRESIAVLVAAMLSLALVTPVTAESRADLEATRKAARAYEGSPPTIPHWYDPLDQSSCITCHSEGLDVGYGRPAPIVPHPTWLACLQCHVNRAEPGVELPENSLTGLGLTSGAHRAHSEAPPVVPHRVYGRDNCASCHAGPGTHEAIRTDHPERQHCLQCHVADTTMEYHMH